MARINPDTGRPYRIGVKQPEFEAVTKLISKVIAVVNASGDLTRNEKAAFIKRLPGITRDEMIELTKAKKTGPGLADSIRKIISPDRAR